MRIPQQLAVSAIAGAIIAAPVALACAGAADAATPFSVSVLHCGGGIHVRAFDTRTKAKHALHKLIEKQHDMPHTLRTIQLRHGDHILRNSHKSC